MKAKLLRLFVPMALVFTMISCSPDSKEEEQVEAKLITDYNYTQDEMKLAEVINNYRISKGFNTLEIINHISLIYDAY
jgi:hypothetical protein